MVVNAAIIPNGIEITNDTISVPKVIISVGPR